jgi:hypothetical protein
MRHLSFYRSPRDANPLVTEYSSPHRFWGDWNGVLGRGKWHRTEQDPDGNPYTVKWSSSAYRNGYGEQAVHTSALWVDGEHGADTRLPAPPPPSRPQIPATQLGRADVGERLRSPHGMWTVTDSWIADKPGAQGEDRDYQSHSIASDRHVYYLLTHEGGRQEEWSAPDMGAAGFHRIVPGEQEMLA